VATRCVLFLLQRSNAVLTPPPPATHPFLQLLKGSSDAEDGSASYFIRYAKRPVMKAIKAWFSPAQTTDVVVCLLPYRVIRQLIEREDIAPLLSRPILEPIFRSLGALRDCSFFSDVLLLNASVF